MWISVLEFVLSFASKAYGFWQKARLKQQVETEVKQEQKDATDKAIKQDDVVRTNATGDSKYLVRPEDR